MIRKLSIIIPTYNAEKYIERCLDSILDQDYHNEIEIIVVNDGSTDSTSAILERYNEMYPSVFRIISKTNGGVSSARNAGKDAASGDWIWFCDADDYICKNGLSYVLDHFVDKDIDVCSFAAIALDAIALKSFKEPETVNGNCFFEGTTIKRYENQFPASIWSHLYRVDAIKDLRFRDLTMCEDVFFNLEAYMKDLRIRCTDVNIYRYTTSEDQLTRKRDKISLQRSIYGFESLFDAAKQYQKSGSSSLLNKGIDIMIARVFSPYISRLLSANLSVDEFSETINRLKSKGIYPIVELERLHVIYNLIGRFPYLYPIESFLYRRIFVPFILPKLSRN